MSASRRTWYSLPLSRTITTRTQVKPTDSWLSVGLPEGVGGGAQTWNTETQNSLLPAFLGKGPHSTTTALPSATTHPGQVEAPESNGNQGECAYAQQQYDGFQHTRITPLVLPEHARSPRNCHHSV